MEMGVAFSDSISPTSTATVTDGFEGVEGAFVHIFYIKMGERCLWWSDLGRLVLGLTYGRGCCFPFVTFPV